MEGRTVSTRRWGAPPRGGLGEGLGRAEQVALCAWGAATLGGRLGRAWGELGPQRHPPAPRGRRRQPTASGLGGLAPSGQAPDGPPGPWCGQDIEESTGPRTAGTIRPVEGWGWGGVRERASLTGTRRRWPGQRGRGRDMRPTTQGQPRSGR